MRKKTIYCIRPKGFNVGNEIIHLALKKLLNEALSEEFNLISIPASSKYESIRKGGFDSKTVYEFNQNASFVILGGGNLYENGEIDIDSTAIKNLTKKLIIYSVSCGRIYDSNLKLVQRTDTLSEENIKLLNQKAYISLSRDISTKKYLESLGLKNDFGGCPTLYLSDYIKKENLNDINYRTDAILSIRTPNLMSIPVYYQNKIHADISNIYRLLKLKGYDKISLLCHDHRDIPFAQSFEDIMDFIYTEDTNEFLSIINSTRLCVTYRLHSFIPAISYKIPSINISYDERSSSLIDSLGMQGWNINMFEDDVIKSIENRLENIESYFNLLKNNEDKWKSIKQKVLKSFFSLKNE